MSSGTDNRSETPSDTACLGVIADDLTGALDAGVQLALAGLETLLWLTGNPPQAQALVISTDSRDGHVETAAVRAQEAAQRLVGRRLFKKIDSTMRGHLSTEIQAILTTAGLSKAVVCPAVIGQERVVRHGRLYVHGVPLDQSEFAQDPIWPAQTAALSGILATPTTHLRLPLVRGGEHGLVQTIKKAPTALCTADAEREADIAALAQGIVGANALPCGALGLARAWIAALEPNAETKPTVKGSEVRIGPGLIISGSKHPRTRTQLCRLKAERAVADVVAVTNEGHPLSENWEVAAQALKAGESAILRAPEAPLPNDAARQALFATLGDWAARACKRYAPAGMVWIGGETARHVARALDVQAIRLQGQIAEGIPQGSLVGGVAHGLAVVTKAGGFGTPDALIRVFDELTYFPASKGADITHQGENQ